MPAVWLYFISRRDKHPLQSVRRAVDSWDMTYDLFSTIEVPSIEWDYLNYEIACDWNDDEVFTSTRAFEDMADDFTRTERLAYCLTACLTSH